MDVISLIFCTFSMASGKDEELIEGRLRKFPSSVEQCDFGIIAGERIVGNNNEDKIMTRTRIIIRFNFDHKLKITVFVCNCGSNQ